jgi:hypothetical protein
MQAIEYTYLCKYTGNIYRVKVDGARSWADEPYPPGGQLRVVRNEKGQAIAGPLVSEIIEWKEV